MTECKDLFSEHFRSRLSVDSALHGATLNNSFRTPGGYTPKLERLLPAPLPVAVVIDLVEPDDDLRECRPSHGLRVPAFLHQPATHRTGEEEEGLEKTSYFLNWNMAPMRCQCLKGHPCCFSSELTL